MPKNNEIGQFSRSYSKHECDTFLWTTAYSVLRLCSTTSYIAYQMLVYKLCIHTQRFHGKYCFLSRFLHLKLKALAEKWFLSTM